MDQYINFINTGDKAQIDTWLTQVDIVYATGDTTMTDEMYDHLIRVYEDRFGKRTVVGAPPIRNAVKLPIAMMSLDKVMTEKELNSFASKNPGPYVVSDKINGNSGLYEIQNGQARLYNRGDGTDGTDLTHILPYLNLPILPFDVYIKGELVVNKKDYEPYKQDYKTNLSMVNGLLNSQNPDPARLKLIKFIAYDIAFPKNKDISLSMSQKLTQLIKYGFIVPLYTTTPILNLEWLSQFYKQQKEHQVYDVDGMVVIADRPIKYEEILIRENPKYSVAFKEYADGHEATVTHVVWEASKHGVIKPVVKVNPVELDNGFTIRSLTAFNAKWIVDNQVGPGTKLMVTHNTIPYILGVISPTGAQMPSEDIYPEGSWKWNETHVDIVLLEDNDEVKIAKIYEFFKQIGAKYWGETTLEKFYHGGFNTIKKMIEGTAEQFEAANIDGIGKGIIERMIKTRDETLNGGLTLAQIMSASGVFGLGFGNRKISSVLDVYPNILDMNPTVEQISAINGFAQKTAERFVEGLPKFKQFMDDIPLIRQIVNNSYLKPALSPKVISSKVVSPKVVSPKVESPKVESSKVVSPKKTNETPGSIKGKSVVFTGFRDKSLEAIIKARGGDVKTGISRKINYVLVGGKKGEGSSKETKAIEYGIPVLTVAEFKEKYNF